jgi:hypothetical protein
VAGLEQFFEKLLGIPHVPTGDPLFEPPHVTGQGLDELLQVTGESGDDRMGQLER